MKVKIILPILILNMVVLFSGVEIKAQESRKVTLKLELNAWQYPENDFRYFSMGQANAWAGNFYEAGFLGVNALSNLLFHPEKSKTSRFLNFSSNYLLGFAFAKYGSSLPVPLGEWQHEEYHRSVLATQGISSKNGMWLFHRWDGTVYGVSDEEMSSLKAGHLPVLLYSYVAGLQAENISTRQNAVYDFFHTRKAYKNPLYLYNAWYVWNYFRFSTSAASDSVRVIAPGHESRDPRERDFAGADLTAWIYDMFRPDDPYKDRDLFPGGEGVNRRIGFSGLSDEGRDYLVRQRSLALLNFLNPAIFGINRISIGPEFSFNFLAQYTPLHFGNDISFLMPVRFAKINLLAGFHRYSNYNRSYSGVELAINELKLSSSGNIYLTAGLHAWEQPLNQGFYEWSSKRGGMIRLKIEKEMFRHFRFYVSGLYKTEGWVSGNAYLNSKAGFSTGLSLIY